MHSALIVFGGLDAFGRRMHSAAHGRAHGMGPGIYTYINIYIYIYMNYFIYFVSGPGGGPNLRALGADRNMCFYAKTMFFMQTRLNLSIF